MSPVRLPLVFRSLAPALLSSCLTPPAVLPGVEVDPVLAAELYPEGTEHVQCRIDADRFLRGLFVPAGEGAPVVLHLLESSGSVASLKLHYEVLCRRLQDLGLASLLVDYAGVGASDGERSPRNLRRDADAMWREAVLRAGGDPSRVILRGISLGTLAAAHLLGDGARPGAVLLHAPVLGQTAVRRFARRRHGPVLAWLAAVGYADVGDVDLVERLAACPAPLLVITGREDFFLSREERIRLGEAVQAANGQWHVTDGGHAQGTLEAHGLRAEELVLLLEHFPPPPSSEPQLEALVSRIEAEAGAEVAARFTEPAARARLARLACHARSADPELLAAVALANDPAVPALRYLWMLDERGSFRELPFGDLEQVVSLDGPAGPLPVDAIERASLLGDMHDRFGGGGMTEGVDLIVWRVSNAMRGAASRVSYEVDVGWDRAEVSSDATELVAQLRALGLDEEDVRRAAVRTLLKAARIAERVRRTPDGSAVLEVLSKGEWRRVDLHAESASIAFTGSLPRPLGRRARALREADEEPLAGEGR